MLLQTTNPRQTCFSSLITFCTSSSLARLVFPAVDDNLLKYNYDDNQRVEPEWYIPIIPMVLVNGTEGIGTGWASKLPNYDVREIINNIHRMLNGEEPLPMVRTWPLRSATHMYLVSKTNSVCFFP